MLRIIKILLLLSTLACTVNTARKYTPVEFQVLADVDFDFPAQKAIYSSTDRTLYVKESRTSKIHVFRNGVKTNVIGGMGSERYRFIKLADICLAADGSLLALDTVEKKIVKFDRDGKYIAEYALDYTAEPSLIEAGRDGSFYIYDSNLREIFLDRDFSRERFRFGKFSLYQPRQMNLADNQLLVYDSESGTTRIFDTLGRFLTEHQGMIQKEKNILYSLNRYYIEETISGARFALSNHEWNYFLISSGYWILLSQNKGVVGTITYELF